MNLEKELKDWLSQQEITSDNIGNIRRACFVPWDGAWNALVRDETAARENAPRSLTSRKLAPEEVNLIVGALDSLSIALTRYHHQWSDGERAIYEQAQTALGNPPPEPSKDV